MFSNDFLYYFVYYNFKIISMILFCIFTIIIDYIFGYLKNVEFAGFISLLPNFLDNLLCCYMKYLIDKKYRSYWNILFFYGLYYFIINTFEFIIIIISDPNDNSEFKVINSGDTKYIILNFFLDAVFYFYLRQLLTMLILEFYSLIHVFISFVLYYIYYYVFDCIKYYDIYKHNLVFLIPAFFEIICLLFFVEILEFNFCGLNKNTKRNIMLRQEEEMLIRNSSSGSNIEIDKDIIIYMNQEKKHLELSESIISDDNNRSYPGEN